MSEAIKQRDHISVVAGGAWIRLGKMKSCPEQAAHLVKYSVGVRLKAGWVPIDVLTKVAGLLVQDRVGSVDKLHVLRVAGGATGIRWDVLDGISTADADAIEPCATWSRLIRRRRLQHSVLLPRGAAEWVRQHRDHSVLRAAAGRRYPAGRDRPSVARDAIGEEQRFHFLGRTEARMETDDRNRSVPNDFNHSSPKCALRHFPPSLKATDPAA